MIRGAGEAADMFAKTAQWVLVAVLCLLPLVATATLASSSLHQHQVDELRQLRQSTNLLDRRQGSTSNFTIVQGIQGSTPQPRLEIRDRKSVV